MINRLSNPINRNRSAAKISKVMSSSVHCALRIETAVEFATYLLLDVKSHVKKIFSTHTSLQSMTASLKTDFSLSLAIIAPVLGVATGEEHAVVGGVGETVGAVESEYTHNLPE